MRNLGLILVFAMLAGLVTPAPAAAQPYQLNIGVQNPGPGPQPPGQSAPAAPGDTTLGIPALTSISPKSVAAGSANFMLSLAGNGFSGRTMISVGANSYAPASATATLLVVAIPAAALTAAGTLPVSVMNPAPGGGTSSALPLIVTAPNRPAPVITSVSPTRVTSGAPSITVSLLGSGFIAGQTSITAAGQAGTVVSPTTATVTLSAASLMNAGTISIAVVNPTPGGGTATAAVTVVNAQPTVAQFSPVSTTAGSAAMTIMVGGTNFATGTMVTFGGTPVPTMFKSSTSLAAMLTESFLQRAGTFLVGAANPAPGGGSATAQDAFVIVNQKPGLQVASPANLIAGSRVAVTVLLSGTKFVATTSAQSGNVPLAVRFVSATALLVTIPPSLLQTAGPLPIIVTNPAPGGGAIKLINLQIGS